VTLEGGARVTADETYLRRSILEPGVQVVAGYANLMPSYAGVLSEGQVTALVAEVAVMKDASAPVVEEAPVKLVVDPVCGMKVRAAPETLHTTYQGHEVYFCSESCRDSFAEHPEEFEKGGASNKVGMAQPLRPSK